jgi:uncharacterized phage protein gp47/JayE
MASLVITDAGISIKSFRELRAELQEEWAKAFGDAIDLSPTSVDGHHLDLECKTIMSVSQLIQAVADNLDPSKATGVWLDILGDYKSMTRISASYSVARVTFMGTNGTVIPERTAVRYYGAPCDFTLQEEIIIGSDGTALGECVADTIGYVEVFVGDWQLVSDIEGVTCKVLQANAGGAGRNDESDAEYRARQKKYSGSGLATFDKMYAYMAGVLGEGNFSLQVNDEDETQNGIPPHRFEFVIKNGIGENNYIAQAVWNCKPAGIKPYGNTSGSAVDNTPMHLTHTMYFSRPVTKYLWVDITLTEYTEESLPADYISAVRTAVEEWAASEFSPGKDVLPKRFYTPIFKVSGIKDAVIKVCLTDTNERPSASSYTTDEIAVGPQDEAKLTDVQVGKDS